MDFHLLTSGCSPAAWGHGIIHRWICTHRDQRHRPGKQLREVEARSITIVITRLTSQLLFSSTPITKRAKTTNELLEINRTTQPTTAISVLDYQESTKGTHSSSKIAIIREANGFVAIWGICKNSSRSIDPERSLSKIKTKAPNRDFVVKAWVL